MACIATHKWRREAKKAKVERRNIELQYHRRPEEHKAQQPPHPYPEADFDKHFEASNWMAASQDVEADNRTTGLKDVEANADAGAVKYA